MLFTPDQSEQLVLASRIGGPPVAMLRTAIAVLARLAGGDRRAGAQFEGDSAVSCLELRTYMLDTLLRDTDAMSMHHSLEVRVPLLDHPLVEFVLGLPDSAKRRPGVTKALLVESLGTCCPPTPAARPRARSRFLGSNGCAGRWGAGGRARSATV